MSTDPRAAFVKAVEMSLVGKLPQEELETVMDSVMVVLGSYEITDRCTEIAVPDTENDKLLNRYCACLFVDGKSEKTIKQYRRALMKLSETLGKNFRDMTAYDLRYYLACAKQRGVSNVTLENTRSYISPFFQWLSNEEIIARNPAAAVNSIKCPKKIKLPFSEVELDAMRGACRNEKDRAVLEMLVSTGVRISELSMMNIEDIDFSALTVHVRHGKGNKERRTYTTKIAALYLQRYLESRKDKSNILFTNLKGERMTTFGFRYILGEIAKRAGVDNVHPHRFRRTFASGLAARGMDVQDIQHLLGHTDINTTMCYVYVSDSKISSSYRQYIA